LITTGCDLPPLFPQDEQLPQWPDGFGDSWDQATFAK
jgi:hypothetical protein